jgi:hypothetical protein
MTDAETVELRDGGWIRYWEHFLPAPEADRLFAALQRDVLLLMGGTLQHHWVHELPKTKQPVGERINLTFRRFIAP